MLCSKHRSPESFVRDQKEMIHKAKTLKMIGSRLRGGPGDSHFNMAEIEEMMHGFSRADSVTGMKSKKQPKWWRINMYHSQLS